MPNHGGKNLVRVRICDLPDDLRGAALKPRLSWLYKEIYDEFPIVRTNFADVIISAYSRRYIQESNIVDILFEDAVKSQEIYPETLKGMWELSHLGRSYEIFKSPACFYIPSLFFEEGLSVAPYSFLVPALKSALAPYVGKDGGAL